jgi:hypothetical protein
VQRLRNTTAVVGLATSMALAWILTEGASLASATTRYRSGAVRTQLASHLSQSAGGAPAPAGLVSTGATVMAGIVALLAVAALAFMVVTFIRRRVVTTA